MYVCRECWTLLSGIIIHLTLHGSVSWEIFLLITLTGNDISFKEI